MFSKLNFNLKGKIRYFNTLKNGSTPGLQQEKEQEVPNELEEKTKTIVRTRSFRLGYVKLF